jgi:hypothetical protein
MHHDRGNHHHDTTSSSSERSVARAEEPPSLRYFSDSGQLHRYVSRILRRHAGGGENAFDRRRRVSIVAALHPLNNRGTTTDPVMLRCARICRDALLWFVYRLTPPTRDRRDAVISAFLDEVPGSGRS